MALISSIKGESGKSELVEIVDIIKIAFISRSHCPGRAESPKSRHGMDRSGHPRTPVGFATGIGCHTPACQPIPIVKSLRRVYDMLNSFICQSDCEKFTHHCGLRPLLLKRSHFVHLTAPYKIIYALDAFKMIHKDLQVTKKDEE